MLCPFKMQKNRTVEEQVALEENNGECQRAYECLTAGEPLCFEYGCGSGITIEDWLRVFDEKS